MTFYIFLGIATFMISLLGTRLTILALRKRTLFYDYPNLRSNHKVPVPRGGGIAVIIAIIIGLLIADVDLGIVLALLLLAAVSLLDDLIGVPAWIRLLVQVMAVSIPLSTLDLPLLTGFFPLWLDKILIGFVWIWFINLFNFMDGIDGLSATEMICIGAGLCLLTVIDGTFPTLLSSYSMVVAAAGCGFFWWNWHPAKIFLGDVGSVPIGFIVGYLLLLTVTFGYGIVVLILPAYYLADSTITLITRIYQGKKIWVGHSEHYYQIAVRAGRRHDTVVRYIFGLNLLLALMAILAVINPNLAMLHLALAYAAVFMLLGFFAHTTHHPHHET